ncbi:ATPase, T2SS/T4P/T4SS family [Bacillus sp. FSL K6-6540]|uniref:ATPase, T2SS/T4P/T4SS family n=1 Tax=Bacillus sp. FSL K6-6540 TaxID=2921512 RepID=UPI0030F99534
MNGKLNLLIIIFIILIFGVLLTVRLLSRNAQSKVDRKQELKEKYTIEKMIEYVKYAINDFINMNLLDIGLSEEEFNRRQNIVAELKQSLKNTSSGDIKDKIYVKEFIFDLLDRNYGLNEENINWVIPFDRPKLLSGQDMFEILIHQYKKEFGYKALPKLIEKHNLDRRKTIIEGGTVESHIITLEEIEDIFHKEVGRLTYLDKLHIVVQRVYQEFTGFGPIDEIRDMAIDGVSAGVSGIPASWKSIDDEVEMMQNIQSKRTSMNYDSIWIVYRGNTIHLSFLSFGSELELKRVCQNIYKYNSPGQLTETNGYIHNEMKDGSRVTVIRPPFAESWAFWVRKFDLPNANLDSLVTDKMGENSIIVKKLLEFLVAGARFTAITGPQNAGKTTLLMALIQKMKAYWNLRIHELVFELHLRRLYPDRNIATVRETDTITGEMGLDAAKKFEGTVTIVGEVATKIVAAWVISVSKVASLFSIFTHHANTTKDLVEYMTNALISTGEVTDTAKAEKQVADAIEIDIHVTRENGKRYIERITEIVRTERKANKLLEDIAANGTQGRGIETKLDALISIGMEWMERTTGQVWEERDLIVYRDGKYVPVARLSDEKVKKMLKIMSEEEGRALVAFLDEHWGAA